MTARAPELNRREVDALHKPCVEALAAAERKLETERKAAETELKSEMDRRMAAEAKLTAATENEKKWSAQLAACEAKAAALQSELSALRDAPLRAQITECSAAEWDAAATLYWLEHVFAAAHSLHASIAGGALTECMAEWRRRMATADEAVTGKRLLAFTWKEWKACKVSDMDCMELLLDAVDGLKKAAASKAEGKRVGSLITRLL